MIDSLAHAVRIVNDSLQVVVGGPPIQVPPAQVVLAPDRGLWASPMFQTLLGGVLAVIGGVGTELFRKWRTDHSKRVKLTKAIETPLRALHYGQLANAARETLSAETQRGLGVGTAP